MTRERLRLARWVLTATDAQIDEALITLFILANNFFTSGDGRC
jgi:hypothetical protein